MNRAAGNRAAGEQTMFDREPEVTSRSIVTVLRRRGRVAGVTFGLVAAAALTFAVAHRPDYAALSHVVLVNDPTGRDPTVMGIDMPTIATGSTVLADVRAQLGLSDSVSDLRKAVVARIAPRSTLMTIAVQNKDPQLAVRLDNAIADTFAVDYRRLAASRYDDVTRRLAADVGRILCRVADVARSERAAPGRTPGDARRRVRAVRDGSRQSPSRSPRAGQDGQDRARRNPQK
jgi:uncharacterized protein involved in exopolysaccharide biosynthesis